MKTKLLTYFSILLFQSAHAQFYNDGTMTNSGGLISDWQNQWFNTTNGVYNGNNNGVFEHHGPSTQTFINDGSFDALSGHTDQFFGPLGAAGPQEIGGTARPFFFNLELNNGASQALHITNTDGANIRGTAVFNNGITTTLRNLHQAGALRFESGAGYTGGNTDAQHVNGYVSKTGTEAFTFPLGSGTDLRTLAIGAPAASSEISAAWFAGDPASTTDPSDGATHSTSAVAAPIITVSNLGFWDYSLVSGNDDGLAVTVSIPDLSSFALVQNLRLVGWNGSQWIDLSGGSNATGNTENSTLSGTIPPATTISALAIGSTSTVLPVYFVSFTASLRNCEVDLAWSTATEENNAFFVVERSTNGAAFTSLAEIAGAGHSTIVRSYAFRDKHPLPGHNYYRIRQVDIDGRSKTTPVQAVSIECDSHSPVKVYPTVAPSAVTVFLTEAYKDAEIRLLDVSGRKMPVTIQKGLLRHTIPMTGVPSGLYMVQVVKDGKTQIFKVIKP